MSRDQGTEGGESASRLSELRKDLEHARRFRIQFGSILLFISMAMTLAGWRAVELFRLPLGLLLGTLPVVLLGGGVILKELRRARIERRRLEAADATDLSALRSAIASDRTHRTLLPDHAAGEDLATSEHDTVSP